MQITEEVQAEIMEILADDQMKHAEFPSDEEIEGMFTAAKQEDDWAKERQLQEMGAEKMLQPPHRLKFTFIGQLERRDEALAEVERQNVETSRNNHQSI